MLLLGGRNEEGFWFRGFDRGPWRRFRLARPCPSQENILIQFVRRHADLPLFEDVPDLAVLHFHRLARVGGERLGYSIDVFSPIAAD